MSRQHLAVTSSRTRRDRARIEIYLTKVDWHLEGKMRSADRKSTLASLREDLLSDPRPMTAVFADLGSPAVLATRCTDEGDLRPLWSVGVITASVALLSYWALFLAFTGGMLSAVSDAGIAKAESFFLFINVEAFADTDGFGIGWTSGWAWLAVPAVVVAIAFLIGSRSWRALHYRTASA